MSQGQFKVDQAWDCIVTLLDSQLGIRDIAKICDRDFNDQGEIIMSPPSARVLFDGEGASSTSDTQRLSYNVVSRFIVLVADQDLSGGSAAQAEASLLIANTVKTVLIGARLLLSDGDISEPLTYVSMLPMPTDGVGTAYAVAFEVPGLAQFPGTNAHPDGGH